MAATPGLAHRFAYHPPADDRTRRAHERVRELLGNAALELDGLLPDGREKSLTFTALEEAMFWANGAVARNGGPA